MIEPAYTRLQIDERRRLLIEAGSALFAEHSFDEISMRQIAQAAGVSKSLLYHYFPSKTELFKAAVEEHATELQQLIQPAGDGNPLAALADSLDAYLAWIDANARTGQSSCKARAPSPKRAQSSKTSEPAPSDRSSLVSRRTARPAQRYAPR